MTITAPGLGAPGQVSPGIGYQWGRSPGFPTPIGTDQLFGAGQHHGSQQSLWQQAYGGQDPYARPQQVQHVVSQLTAQILPMTEQIVLPQVIALAVQLVQQQVQQLVTQVAVPQIMGQYPAQASQWQQPQPFSGQQAFSGQQPQSFFAQQPSTFAPTVWPYAGLY